MSESAPEVPGPPSEEVAAPAADPADEPCCGSGEEDVCATASGSEAEPGAAPGEEGVDLVVDDLCCASEVAVIERALDLEGVRDVRADTVRKRVRVIYDPSLLGPADISSRIEGAGFETRREATGEMPTFRSREGVRVGVAWAALVGAAVVWALSLPEPVWIGLCLVATAVGGFRVFRRGLVAVRQGTADMNLLMSVAALGALGIQQWFEGATVMALFALAGLLEQWSMGRTRRAISSLLELAPSQALVRRDGETEEVPARTVEPGEVVLVRPGARVPVDGTVVSGRSEVDQAPITGESVPVAKEEGDEVYAGTINEAGALEVRCDRQAAESTLARIIHLVEEAQATRAPTQSTVERFARVYTPAVILGAAAIALVPPLLGAPFLGRAGWLYRGLVLLVIACPCALVISTPVSIVAGLTAGARHGILIKGGAFLEAMGEVRTVFFDKTGTVTRGRATVTDVELLPGGDGDGDEDAFLSRAAAVEEGSEHHVGAAIRRAARDRGLGVPSVEEFRALPGRGVRARLDGATWQVANLRTWSENGATLPAGVADRVEALEDEGRTVVLAGPMDRPLGLLAVADEVRPGTDEVLASIRREGVERLTLLTGDNRRTAEGIGGRLGFDEIRAELLPEEKVEAVDSHRSVRLAEGHPEGVAMVGDGVNDAPALAAADVGIAMGTAGTDAAIETADVALMGDDLRAIPFALRIARRTRAIIRQNIGLSLGIKAIVLALAIPGWATLWMAVAADMGSSLLVIGNGLRLFRVAPTTP